MTFFVNIKINLDTLEHELIENNIQIFMKHRSTIHSRHKCSNLGGVNLKTSKLRTPADVSRTEMHPSQQTLLLLN